MFVTALWPGSSSRARDAFVLIGTPVLSLYVLRFGIPFFNQRDTAGAAALGRTPLFCLAQRPPSREGLWQRVTQ